MQKLPEVDQADVGAVLTLQQLPAGWEERAEPRYGHSLSWRLYTSSVKRKQRSEDCVVVSKAF